jgi:hypothetical protein
MPFSIEVSSTRCSRRIRLTSGAGYDTKAELYEKIKILSDAIVALGMILQRSASMNLPDLDASIEDFSTCYALQRRMRVKLYQSTMTRLITPLLGHCTLWHPFRSSRQRRRLLKN